MSFEEGFCFFGISAFRGLVEPDDIGYGGCCEWNGADFSGAGRYGCEVGGSIGYDPCVGTSLCVLYFAGRASTGWLVVGLFF